MKVTVSLVTYNHAPFIRQAIESVLSQKTDFDFELLIGEDDSTDGTREIVREYAAKYPENIRVIYNERKNVIYYRGKPTGRYNLVTNLRNATGQYVALLEGDDYWADPQKLQKQVDHLDRHPEQSCCFHDVLVLEDKTGVTRSYPIKVRQAEYSLKEFIEGHAAPHTSSIFFRNGLIGEFPDWFYCLAFADKPLLVLLGERGTIGFLPEVMSVYRVHQGGILHGGSTGFWRWSNKVAIERVSSELEYYETIRQYLRSEYRKVIDCKIAGLNYELVWLFQRQNNYRLMRKHLLRAFQTRNFEVDFSLGHIFRSSLIAFFPLIYRIYLWVRNKPTAPIK